MQCPRTLHIITHNNNSIRARNVRNDCCAFLRRSLMINFETVIKHTDLLSAQEIVNIMKERTKVFVVEQNCAYQEVDNKDDNATHVLFKLGNQIVAYTRIVPHDNNIDISFGRVLVVKEYRKLNLGRQIVETTIKYINDNYPNQHIKIQAQNYLKHFYESFGFISVSDVYLEDDIPHIDMVINHIN